MFNTLITWFSVYFMRLNFDLKKRLTFYRIMMKATDEKRHGIRVKQLLESLIKIEMRNNKHSLTCKMYQRCLQSLNKGLEFGLILSEYIPASEAMIIAASETSGKISEGFMLADAIARNQSQLKNAFISALLGPSITLLMTIVILSFFCIKIIPILQSSMIGVTLSSYSQILIIMANNYYIWFPIVIILVLSLVILIIWALPNYKTNFRVVLDKIPPFSLYKLFIGCSFLQAFNALTKSGVQQVKALNKMGVLANPYLKYRIDRVLYFMNRGVTFGQALISSKLNFPDSKIVDELSIHAETGNLDNVLDDIVKDLNFDALELIKSQANIAKYLCTFITVGVILFLVLGMFSFVQDMQASTV